VQAIETDGPTQQGIRVAAMNNEIIFATIESHRRGGARVEVPLDNRGLWMWSH